MLWPTPKVWMGQRCYILFSMNKRFSFLSNNSDVPAPFHRPLFYDFRSQSTPQRYNAHLPDRRHLCAKGPAPTSEAQLVSQKHRDFEIQHSPIALQSPLCSLLSESTSLTSPSNPPTRWSLLLAHAVDRPWCRARLLLW